jgi:hypothetical protein
VQGPVHAYASVAGGATPYLSELESGSQVLVVDAKGNARTVLVGRVQIESKPLVLIVVEVFQNLLTLLFLFFPPDYGGCYTICVKNIELSLLEIPLVFVQYYI